MEGGMEKGGEERRIDIEGREGRMDGYRREGGMDVYRCVDGWVDG